MVYEITALNGYELAAKMNKLATMMGIVPRGLETFKHRIVGPFRYEIKAVMDVRRYDTFNKLNATI